MALILVTHVQLRPATLDDAQLISRWVASPDELLVFAGPKLAFPLDPQALLDTSRDGWTVCALRVDGELVGTGSFILRDGGVHLGRLLVDPQHRGQGHGRTLVKQVLEHARLHSPELARATRATLNVFTDNLAARSLYDSLGFQTTGEGELHDGRESVRMAKALGSDIK
ncbi:GNAT family N-acetyltransferase [Luteococcus sp. H138]|uniref:GNAT family N-acetyltransferase n=1 Tax=unclassified Luteococcus TaxID=2639923 RepID=UPI00313B38A2